VEQVQIYDKTRADTVPLTVHDAKGNVINENIFVTTVTIWNSGNSEIKKEDLRRPFHLTVEGNTTQILDTGAIFFSKDNIDNFAVNPNNGEITWEHFDAGEGLKIRIMYTNPTMQNVNMDGYAVGTPVVNEYNVPPGRLSDPGGPPMPTRGPRTYDIVMLSVVTLLGMLIAWTVGRNVGTNVRWWDLGQGKWMLLLTSIVLLVVTMFIWSKTNVEMPPF
jgi:hypothetical protein